MALIDLTLNELGVKVVIVAPVVVFAILLRWLYKLIIDPLRDIPGPFFARFTTLWMVRYFIKGDFEQINVALHAQYGKLRALFSVKPGRSKAKQSRTNCPYCPKPVQH